MFHFKTTPTFTVNKNLKVIVIGAGLAGLTAAYRLHQKGMNVEVYEARKRVGGRIFTVNVSGTKAELGAQNITDGKECHNLYRLINDLGLEVVENKASLNPYYFTNNSLISLNDLLKTKRFDPVELHKKLQELKAKSRNMKEILNALLDENDPLYKATAVRLAAYEGGNIENLSPFYIETLFHMLTGGVSSAHQANSDQDAEVNLMSVKNGNGALPEKIKEILGLRLHLNMPLIRVSKEKDHSLMLTFQNGQKVKADKLILAIPCSVYSDIIFDDHVIPMDKLNAIKTIRYGANSKILVPLDRIPPKSNGLIGDKIISFRDVARNLLTIYFTGETSFFTKETIANAYQQSRAMIEMGFQDFCPLFTQPTLAEDQAFSNYEGPVGYSWPNDPYAKGSYSYISLGQETLLTATKKEDGELVKTLFAPIEHKVYFAGEHASILSEVPGTMEAACESGERIARMVLNLPN